MFEFQLFFYYYYYMESLQFVWELRTLVTVC